MEILREFLVNIMLIRNRLVLLHQGPTAWTIRGEKFVRSFPHYKQFTKHVFAYAKSVAQGPPEQALAAYRNVFNRMDTFYLGSPGMSKKRPTINERLERIEQQYEQVRILSALADVASPRPDGRACGTEPGEILSRFGAVGFKPGVRDDLRNLRNGYAHKRMRYEAASVRVFDENNQFIKSFNAEQIKYLDKMLSDLFDWASSAMFGALWENPTLLLMFFVLMLYEPDFSKSLKDKWNTVKIFNPKLFKIMQSGRKSRQKKVSDQEWVKGITKPFRQAIATSIPKELSVNELTAQIENVLFEIVLEIRALSRDSERFLSILAQQSGVPDLKDLLLKLAKVIQAFTIPLLTSEDFEGHLIGQPNIPELLEAIRKLNIILPASGTVQKHLSGHQSDSSLADCVEERVASPVTGLSEDTYRYHFGIGIFISIIFKQLCGYVYNYSGKLA